VESAAPALGENGSRKFAHTGKRRNFLATTPPPSWHSRVELEEASSAVDAWEPLGVVLQRLLTKLAAQRRA
jgi:hypothetical protein